MNEIGIFQSMPTGSWGIWTLVGLSIVTLIKGWPAIKKLQNEADGSMRHDFLTMISDLRHELEKEKERCTASEETLRSEINRLHGQIHELRNAMVELTLGAARANSAPLVAATEGVAKATSRVADAAELAVKGEVK